MTRTRTSRHQRTLAAAACVFFGPTVGQAIAQNAGAPKPEIMLLLGASRTMERAVGTCTPDGCVPEDAACYNWAQDPRLQPPGNRVPPVDPTYTPSRMHLIKQALTGGSGGPFICAVDQECVKDNASATPNACSVELSAGEDNDADLAHYHYRQWCCVGGNCASAVPCGGDSGDMTVNDYAFVSADPGANILPYTPGASADVDTQGVVYALRSDVKFGLMTYDASVDKFEGWRGGFSYPNIGYVEDGVQFSVDRAGAGASLTEPSNLPVADAAAASRLIPPVAASLLAGTFDRIRIAQDPTRPNLGIKNSLAPFGGLVDSNLGLVNDPNRTVGEADANVANHNLFVGERIRSVVPSGSAPVAAALHDALEYYKRSASDHGDPANACRDRTLVLIGDEAPTRYVGGYVDNSAPVPASCARDADCNAVPGGRCETPNPVLDPNSRVSKAAHALCVYPDGYPYRSSVDYAGELYQAGVPVYVVGFAPTKEAQRAFQAIADAGSPGRGPNGTGGYFRADDADQLRAAITKIRNSQVAGTRSHLRPLVLFPRKGDTNAAPTTRQWRLNAWSEVPGSADPFWYGKLERSDLACPAPGAPGAETAARVLAGSTEFQSVLNASPNAPRRVVAQEGGRIFTASGGAGANMFNADGTIGGAYPEPTVRSLTSTIRPGGAVPNDAADEALRFVGRQMNGYFGARGLPGGARQNTSTRVLGAIVNSELVAITPPALPLTAGAYVSFATAHRDRPTLIATGANDGMVHLFRADTGAEVVNFVPFSAWPALRNSSATRLVDGPLDVGDVSSCRSYGAATPTCPAGLTEPSLRTMLVGSVGKNGSNVFGIDVTHTTTLAKQVVTDPVSLPNLFQGGPANSARIWDITPSTGDVEYKDRLGRAVSRPALTHVRDGDKVRAAVIVGCGDDDTGPLASNLLGVGRCVLVLDAITGQKITVLDGNDLETSAEGNFDMPVTGSAAVWPRGGIAPADRAYIGDKIGRLWRIDLRDKDVTKWKMRLVSPPVANAGELAYKTGREVIGRPALFAQESGKLAILYTTGGPANLAGNPAPAVPPAYAVSITDALVTNAQGVQVFQAARNWVFPMGFDEIGTGEVSVVGNIALFTTQQSGVQVCASATGRLYGVHATDRYRDANNAPATFRPAPPAQGLPADPRLLTVKPMLPNLASNAPGNEILAVQLPPGRIAYGVTIAEVPSCTDGEGTSTEVVMNLADDERGRRGAPRPADMYMESVQNGQITKLRYDNNIFAKSQKTELSLCLNCGQDGKARGGRQNKAPFVASVSYWGSTFTE
jgi:hypothetical protein